MSPHVINVEQCLFGYNDGHRLLASSIKLSTEILSDLASLSDLAPGALFGTSDGYWTGVPLPSMKVYALVRTWPAPEMSRPGCVWSHTLFLELSALEQIDDLLGLWNIVKRPQGPSFETEYGTKLTVYPDRLKPSPELISGLKDNRTCWLLDSIYGDERDASIPATPGELDALVFAIWSQQWPKLRRNFRFQTAVIRGPRPPSDKKFDFRLTTGGTNLSSTVSNDMTNVEPWLKIAIADLEATKDGDFRVFLREYGISTTKPKSSFRLLSKIYALTRELSNPKITTHTLSTVIESFPNVEEATSLKLDLVNGRGFFKDADLISRLIFLLDSSKASSLPEPSAIDTNQLKLYWPDRAVELIALAEHAIRSSRPVADVVLNIVSATIPDERVWSLLENHRELFLHLLRSRPALIVLGELNLLSSEEVFVVIQSIPKQALFWNDLLQKLLTQDDHQIAKLVFGRVPKLASQAVVDFIDQSSARTDGPASPWLKQFGKNGDGILSVNLFRNVSRVSTLYAIANNLDWLSPVVLKAGPDPWLTGLKQASYDLDSDQIFIFLSFLIGLAMRHNSPEVAKLFQIAFDPVHQKISRSYLPYMAQDMFISTLPELSMFKNWDTAKRLEIGVAKRFVELKLDCNIFAKLSKDKRVMHNLEDIAVRLPGGGKYRRKKQ